MYLRTVHTDTTISVDLIMAKGKVAPIKDQTIPRLELCDAQLLSKLLSQVSADLAVLEEVIVITGAMSALT